MYNKRELKKATKAAAISKAKTNPFGKDVIYGDAGQWKNPGEITRIPGDAYGTPITMNGVPTPLFAQDNLGNSEVLYPGQDYIFPGQYVTEYPMLAFGGDPSYDQFTEEFRLGGSKQLRIGKRNKTSKNLKTSVNYLQLQNETLFGPPGRRIYDPNAKMEMGGWLDKYQPGGEVKPKTKTVVHTDKALFDKAYKAEMDSLYLYNHPKPIKSPTSWDYGKTNPLIKAYGMRSRGIDPVRWSREGDEFFANWKKPVIHNIYEPPVEPLQDTVKPVVAPVNTPVYHPVYQQEIPGIKKSKQNVQVYQYENGGWLDDLPTAQDGRIQAATTAGATPISTQAPVNPTNPTGWDWVKHKWNTRDQGPGDWDMGYIDPRTGSYVNAGVTPFDLMLPVQAVSGAKATMAAKNIKKATPKSLPKQNVNLGNIKDRVIEPSKTGAALREELEPYLSHRLPSREADRYARSTANTVDEYAKNWREAVQHFDREGNTIPDPVQKGVNPGIMDILWDGLLPKTPFNEVPVGNQYYYRKIGNKEGLEDLIKTGTTRQPGNKWEGAFYGWRKPIEDYAGRYAVGYDTKASTIGMDFCKPGRPGCVGYLPTKKIDINDPALNVYRRKFMSTGYKKLDKTKLAEELDKNYSLQEKAENILRPALAWGARYAVGHDVYNRLMRPHTKEEDMYLYKTQKALGLKQYGGQQKGWLDEYA